MLIWFEPKDMDKPKHTILYIDDLPHLRDSYKSAFDEAGLIMVTFSDARGDLVKKVVEVKPDLILLDICMPDVDGFEALQILRGDKKTRDIPIFFFSNLSSKNTIQKGIDFGADDYIVKSNCSPDEAVGICNEYLKDPENYHTRYQKNI